MDTLHPFANAKRRCLIRTVALVLITLGISGTIPAGIPSAWSMEECAQRYWEQLRQDSWKQWHVLSAQSQLPRAYAGKTDSNVTQHSPERSAQPSSSAGSPGIQAGSNAAPSVYRPDPTPSRGEQLLRETLLQELLTDADRDLIVEVYQSRNWEPFFIGSGFQLSTSGMQLLARLQDLEDDAIDPQPYKIDQLRADIKALEGLRQGPNGTVKASLKELLQSLKAKAGEASPFSWCESTDVQRLLESAQTSADISISKAAKSIQAGLQTWGGQMINQAGVVDVHLASGLIRFAQDMQRFSRDSIQSGLTGKYAMSELLKSLEPALPHYQALRRGYLTYRKLAHRSEQKNIRTDGSVRPGTRAPVIRTLQERLREEGFYTGETNGIYDTATVDAVKRFQAQHLQDADGVLGKRTVEWLNVAYEKKAKMIAQSLEALRKSETRRHERFVRINIPQFVLEYVKDGKVETTNRVIVGKSAGKRVKVQGRVLGENQTPTFASSIQQLVFNPRWYVSDRISLELDVEANSDPNYFQRLGYVKMSSSYPWGSPRLYQRPGPNNPLGRVKFEFPNAYAVFLHDTPNKSLFRRARRDFSHGCMRVEGAVSFARMLLKDDENPLTDKADSYLADFQPKHINLQHPVPIIVEYATVSSDGGGHVIFCGDLYGWFQNLS
jgi:murein L,D-transpeptidase YcbB/YkuD